MNAHGIMQATAPTGRSGGTTAGTASSSQTQAGESASFAGMLVQVIGETPNTGGDSTAGKGILIGVPIAPDASSIVEVPEVLTANVPEAELKPLLQGLLEQLAKLDENGELPADFEQNLASLLNLLHQLLKTPEALSGGTYAADDSGHALPDNKAAETLLNTTHGRPLAQAVAETLLQWSSNLAQGNKLTVSSLSALAETLRQIQQLVQKPSSPAQTNAETAIRIAANAGSNHSEGSAQTASNTAAAANTAEQGGPRVETFMQRTTTPFRHPAWAQQAIGAQATDSQLTGAPSSTAAAADTAEPASPTSAVPLWTLFKGTAGTPLTGGSQAQATLGNPVPVHEFAEQMGKFLVKQFVLSRGDGTTEARISLHPEHLGQVNIKIMIQNGMLTAKFMAESGVARDLLESQMAQLRTALQGQGLQVDKVEVVQQSHANAASFFQHHHREQGSGHAKSQAGQRGSNGLYGDDADFEQELERTAYLREVGYGISLNVTA